MVEAFLVDGARTPTCRFGGALGSGHPDDLAARRVKTVIERVGINLVDEVIAGNANGAGEDQP